MQLLTNVLWLAASEQPIFSIEDRIKPFSNLYRDASLRFYVVGEISGLEPETV